MFGLLDIKTCSLKKETKRFYACNVCNSLSSRYGRLSRMLLTNDAVYLSLLIAAQQRPFSTYSKSFTPCRPWSKKSLSLPEFEYPAAVSLLENGVNLFDDIKDEKSVQSKILYFYYKNKIKQAEINLRSFGVSIQSINDLIENQQKRECNLGKNLGYYSSVTEEMYSSIFAQTAFLANASQNYQYLENVGRDVGRIAYFLDGYMDFEQDQKKGRFNVFSKIDVLSHNNQEKNKLILSEIVHEGLNRIKENITKIELYRHADTIRYIVTDGLKTRIQNILDGKGVWLTRPQIILGLVPFAFILMQIDGGECCPCGEPGAMNCCSFEPASGGASNGDRIAISVAEGVVGAAVGAGGAAVASGALSNAAGSSVSSSEAVSTQTIDTSVTDINVESLPESSPETPPLSVERWADTEIRERIKSRLPPGTPTHYPLLPEEEMILQIDFNDPIYGGDNKYFTELTNRCQENIKFDLKAEEDRKKRGISNLHEEYKEIWKNRPKAVDDWYNSQKHIKDVKKILDGEITLDRLNNILENKLSKSSKPEEREWIKKFQSVRRRNNRFHRLPSRPPIKGISRDDAATMATVAGGGGG